MLRKSVVVPLHAVFGATALIIIAGFFLSSAIAVLSDDAAVQHAVKIAILWGLLGLIPCLAATGAMGAGLAQTRRDSMTAAKFRRMKAVAAFGIGILVPCALYLGWLALRGQPIFLPVQLVELAAGACNIALLSLNLRDGLRMRRRRAV